MLSCSVTTAQDTHTALRARWQVYMKDPSMHMHRVSKILIFSGCMSPTALALLEAQGRL